MCLVSIGMFKPQNGNFYNTPEFNICVWCDLGFLLSQKNEDEHEYFLRAQQFHPALNCNELEDQNVIDTKLLLMKRQHLARGNHTRVNSEMVPISDLLPLSKIQIIQEKLKDMEINDLKFLHPHLRMKIWKKLTRRKKGEKMNKQDEQTIRKRECLAGRNNS